jgi:hypothetical protein
MLQNRMSTQQSTHQLMLTRQSDQLFCEDSGSCSCSTGFLKLRTSARSSYHVKVVALCAFLPTATSRSKLLQSPLI